MTTTPRSGRHTLLRTTLSLLAILAGMVTLGACGDGGSGSAGGDGNRGDSTADVPEGFRIARHPAAEIALPADWTPADEPVMAEADPDALELGPPGLTDLSLGVWLWRYDTEVPEGFPGAPLDEQVVGLLGMPGYEELRNEAFEVAGADEAHILQAKGQATALEGEPVVHFTYVSARAADGSMMVLRLAGPRDDLPEDLVGKVLDTFRVIDG